VSALLLRDVEVDGRRVDVLLEARRIGAVDPKVEPAGGAEVIDGGGGALIPGLWDHHIHLLALAAARRSAMVGPPAVADRVGMTEALRRADRGGWVRAVGYHESVAGLLDRSALERLAPGFPVRVQHRSGACWTLNDSAIDRLGLDLSGGLPPGAERDEHGRLTGRFFGLDSWLRDLLDRATPEPPPDLAPVGRELARYGVVGVTDATPYERAADLAPLASAAASSALPQRIVVMGGPALASTTPPAPLGCGPVKLLLADHDLPSLEALERWIAAARVAGRPVAVHSVTRASLVLALAALESAPPHPGDRIEHGAVIPPEMVPKLVERVLTVVTQPSFVAERGDRYLQEVDPADQPYLYPCRSLLDAGMEVAGSTDAPFGHPDPWRAVAAAVNRRTRDGRSLGADEAVDPATALRLLLGSPERPGGPPRTVTVGAPADLCLLRVPLADALRQPAAEHVRATIVDGQVVHHAD
jgi:predicted amidohydrolase YtcJ